MSTVLNRLIVDAFNTDKADRFVFDEPVFEYNHQVEMMRDDLGHPIPGPSYTTVKLSVPTSAAIVRFGSPLKDFTCEMIYLFRDPISKLPFGIKFCQCYVNEVSLVNDTVKYSFSVSECYNLIPCFVCETGTMLLTGAKRFIDDETILCAQHLTQSYKVKLTDLMF